LIKQFINTYEFSYVLNKEYAKYENCQYSYIEKHKK